MPKPLGFLSADGAQGTAVLHQLRSLDAVQSDVTSAPADDADLLATADREQLQRDIAAIERATAALRRAEPALQSWTSPPVTATLPQPRPLWLLIGALWISTALITLGALYAISAFVG
jgi:hypothetical protein